MEMKEFKEKYDGVSICFEMPKISEIIDVMAPEYAPEGTSKRLPHKMRLRTKGLKKMIDKDVQVVAFACNPGATVIITEKRAGMDAFIGSYSSFPTGAINDDCRCIWAGIEVYQALDLIKKKNTWITKAYSLGKLYADSYHELVGVGIIECTNQGWQINMATLKKEVASYYKIHIEWEVRRLKNGNMYARARRRGEKDTYTRMKLIDFIDVIPTYDIPNTFPVHRSDMPRLNGMFVLKADVPKELLTKLKGQVIKQKILGKKN